jgi:hypothetical protein
MVFLADSAEQRHSLFSSWTDESRVAAGQDFPKAFGTCLEKRLLRCDHVSSPILLKNTLLDADLRGEYVEPAVGDDGTVYPGGRRIDLVLVSKAHPTALATDRPTLQYNTAFAGLSDHISLIKHFRI